MYISALGLQAVWMLTLGIMGSVPVSEETTAIGIAVMLLLANFTFKIALGPIGFTIVGEMPSGRVRAQTIVLGRICYVAGGLAVDQLIPRMINPTAWNLKAKTGYFFLGCDVVLFIYQYFRLAETRVSPWRKNPKKPLFGDVADFPRIVPSLNSISYSPSKSRLGNLRSIRLIVSPKRRHELTSSVRALPSPRSSCTQCD